MGVVFDNLIAQQKARSTLSAGRTWAKRPHADASNSRTWMANRGDGMSSQRSVAEKLHNHRIMRVTIGLNSRGSFVAYLRRWLSCSLWTKRLKTTTKNRSTLAPMPGFLLSLFPAMFNRLIWGFLRSH